MTLSFTTISNTIAALSIAGLTIKDIDEVPAKGDRVPILFALDNFITNFVLVDKVLGVPSTRSMTVTYTMNYRLLFAKVGEGRTNILEAYNGLSAMVGLILDAILAMDTTTGVEDLVPGTPAITNLGQVLAQDALIYYGCDFHFDCTEFVN